MLIKSNYSNSSNNSNNYKTQNKFNFGLGILKVFLSFDVIRSHCFRVNSTNNKFIRFCMRNRRIHVPSFFIISFYFIHKEFISFNINKSINRIKRLITPYLGWPIIIWILNNIINYYFKTDFSSSFKALKDQLIWGNIFIIQFWFLWDLIIITILFYMILYIFKSNYLLILQFFAYLTYFFQYSGYNKKMYLYFKRECLGRFAEVIPYSVTGLTLASLKIINSLKLHYKKNLIFSLLIYILIEKYPIFASLDGVAYAGIKLNISSICIIFIFSLFSFDKISNNLILDTLKIITNYTGGIFYLHWTIIKYLRNYVNIIKIGSFSGCIFIYFICYIICLIGMKFFGKTKLKNLFS